MRQSTKSVIGVLSLGVLASSYSLGLAQANEGLSSSLNASGQAGSATANPQTSTNGNSVEQTSPTATAAPTAAPTANSTSTANSNSTASAEPKASSTPAKKAAATPKATSTATATPTPAKTSTPAPSKTAASNEQTGDAINYKYGQFKIQVVKSGGAIASINVLTGTTRGGQYAAIIPELVAAAVSANGSNFGNYSGATFTTNAFKQALESALAKF